jgi:hypothetical protein
MKGSHARVILFTFLEAAAASAAARRRHILSSEIPIPQKAEREIPSAKIARIARIARIDD